MHYPDNLARWAQRVLGRIEAQGYRPCRSPAGAAAAMGRDGLGT
jgi:hypothetical protein